MAQILLKTGEAVLVDDDQLARLSEHSWCRQTSSHSKKIYAVTCIGYKSVLMHRLITGAPDGLTVDHINGNGLDNRQCNLRICTLAQNLANREKSNGRHPYKGIWQNPVTNRWGASIQCDGLKHHLGYFDSPEDAARAYNEAATRLHGPFAKLNPI